MFTRQCKKCLFQYQYEGCANLIAFCPNCNSYDYLECEYGYGPVVPCKIYHGSREIGMVTYDKMDRMKYRIDSDVFNIHKVLENTYLNALYEAKDMVTDLLQERDISCL